MAERSNGVHPGPQEHGAGLASNEVNAQEHRREHRRRAAEQQAQGRRSTVSSRIASSKIASITFARTFAAAGGTFSHVRKISQRVATFPGVSVIPKQRTPKSSKQNYRRARRALEPKWTAKPFDPYDTYAARVFGVKGSRALWRVATSGVGLLLALWLGGPSGEILQTTVLLHVPLLRPRMARPHSSRTVLWAIS